VGATQEEATEAMDLAVTAFQLGGWNIQWKKSDLQVKSQVKYLGFTVDLADFTYSAASSKVQDVEADIQAFMNPEQIYKVRFQTIYSNYNKCIGKFNVVGIRQQGLNIERQEAGSIS
jgi:hypothetical protein